MTAPISIPDRTLITRRSIFIGAAASLLCAPAIVRATNLMPVRRIILKSDVNYYGFLDRLWASQYFSTIMERQNAGLSANEIAAEMNAKGYTYPWHGETREWNARRVPLHGTGAAVIATLSFSAP